MELTNCNKAEIYAVDGTPLCEAHVYWDSAGMYQLLEVPCSFELSDTGEHMAIFMIQRLVWCIAAASCVRMAMREMLSPAPLRLQRFWKPFNGGRI